MPTVPRRWTAHLVAHVERVARVFVGAGAAALDDEVGRHAVEREAVVVALPRAPGDADGGEGSEVHVQRDVEAAAPGHGHAQPLAAQLLDRGQRDARRRHRLRAARGAPVQACRISAVRRRRVGRILQVCVQCPGLRLVAERLQAFEDGDARVARRVLVFFRDAASALIRRGQLEVGSLQGRGWPSLRAGSRLARGRRARPRPPRAACCRSGWPGGLANVVV